MHLALANFLIVVGALFVVLLVADVLVRHRRPAGPLVVLPFEGLHDRALGDALSAPVRTPVLNRRRAARGERARRAASA